MFTVLSKYPEIVAAVNAVVGAALTTNVVAFVIIVIYVPAANTPVAAADVTTTY